MNNAIMQIIAIAIAAVVGVIIGLPWLFKLRRVFLVPEGYAGLLYCKGKFAEALSVGDTSAGVATSCGTRSTCARRHCSWRVRKS